jgi:hypothetical protein
MSTALRVRILIFALPLAIAACGGGSGGGSGAGGGGTSGPPAATVTGNGLAPASGPGDTASYFPSTTGDQWSFNYTTNDSTALSPYAIVGVAVNGTKTVQGVSAMVFTRTDPTVASGGSDQYFHLNGGGVTLLGNSDATDSITPLIAPYVELLFPVQVGSVSSLSGTNLPFGKDKNGNSITLNLTQTIANVAIESVDVPAGTFANAMHQTTKVTGTAFDSGQSTPAVSGTDDIWLVPGIGQVKEQTAAGAGATLVNSAAELRGYTVNGKAHGLGTASAVTPNLVSANCLGGPTFFAPANVASDGTNFLAVALACDNSSGTVQVKWIATLIGPDGTVKTSVDLSPATGIPVQSNFGTHAVVAFDGTNYLVIHEDIYGATSSPNLLALLVSRSGSIVSGPNVVGAAFQTSLPGDQEALGFDGSRYLLVYGDANAIVRPPQMSGLFISPATGLPDGAPFTISNTNIYERDGPAVGFDGTNYLVVWGEFGLNPTGLRAMRVSKAGALLDSTPLLVMDASSLSSSSSGVCCDLSPSVTFDGTNYLVAYRDPRGAAPYSNTATVSAARVSPAAVLVDGTAAVPGIVVSSATGIVVDRVRSAFINGAHWLAWGSGDPSSLSASRVSPSGAVPAVWPNGFILVPASAAGATAQWPAVVAGTNGGMVTWLQAQPDATSTTSSWSMPIYSQGP